MSANAPVLEKPSNDIILVNTQNGVDYSDFVLMSGLSPVQMVSHPVDLLPHSQIDLLRGIHKADCVAFMADELPAECIDFIAADPPYGVNFQSCQGHVKKKKIKNDKTPFLIWLPEAYRVLKSGGAMVCFYDWRWQSQVVAAIEAAGFKVRSQIIWDKMEIGMGDLKSTPGPSHELALLCTKGKYLLPGKRPKTVYSIKRVNSNHTLHPNQKPVSLMRELVIDYTMPGAWVYDPFGGIFTTQKACDQVGRNCVSTEMDDHYFDLGHAHYSNAPVLPLPGLIHRPKVTDPATGKPYA